MRSAMKRRAFTLAEVLTVIGIVVMVAAITLPVFLTTKDRAKAAVSGSNLKQLHMATVLYQEDYDGSGVYGDIYMMGLPPWPVSDRIPELRSLRPPKAPHPVSNFGVYYYCFFVQPELDQMPLTWGDYAREARERSVLYIDPFDNDPSISLTYGNSVTRHFLAVDVSGTLMNKRGTGDWLMRRWWLTH